MEETNIIHNLQTMKDKSGTSRRKYDIQRKYLKRCNINIPANRKLAQYRKHLMDKFFILEQTKNGNGYKIENCFEKIEFYLKRYFKKKLKEIESNPKALLTIQQIIPNDTFYLKLAGDGASLNNSQVNVLNFTFVIINDIENAMSVNGNYLLGKRLLLLKFKNENNLLNFFLLKGMSRIIKENFETLLENLEEILNELKEIRTIKIEEKDFNIEFLGGGDMKYERNMLGLDSSSSHYCCMYCTCDFTKEIDYEKGYKMNRNPEEALKSYSLLTKDQRKGYINKPILDFIRHENIIFCHLHMFKRIFEKLMDALFMKINEKDGRNDSMKLEDRPNLKILYNFLLDKCKIIQPFTFNVNEKTIILRKNLNKNDQMRIFKRFFDLDENDKENFKKKEEDKSNLKKLFPNIDLDPKMGLSLENAVFKQYLKLDYFLTNYSKIPLDLGQYENCLKEWLKAYTQLNVKEEGERKIPPYIHIWVFHTVQLLVIHGDIHILTGQGLEKYNDVVKSYYKTSVCKKYDKVNEEGCINQLIKHLNRIELDREGVTYEEIRSRVIGRNHVN